ncbi:stalk domain-containing protein [Paenibacillus sp. YN15]|uniref:stalk domain-containing protein n=1 Tax=Paenibacillus sp. YN15 TaxID=1742774 RepID=UPI000DCF5903|nr:stalk domain-containing protein [Paenibacillus sp. YN15]RAU91046.1 hypothetical protein DQG13_30005 [Paenibacillus sp. YN15]
MKKIRSMILSLALIGSMIIANASAYGAGEAELPIFNTIDSYTTKISLSRDGQFMLTASEYGNSIWHLDSGRSSTSPKLKIETIEDAAFSPDGSLLAVAGRYEGLMFLNPQSGEIVGRVLDPYESQYGLEEALEPEAIQFSNDGKTLIAGIRAERISIIDVDSQKETYSVPIQGTVQKLVFNPRKNEFVLIGEQNSTGYGSGLMQIRDGASASVTKSFGIMWKDFRNVNFYDVSYSPDGKFMALSFDSSENSGTFIYDAANGYNQIATLKTFGSLSFTADSQLLIVGDHAYPIEKQFKENYKINALNAKSQIAPTFSYLTANGKYLVVRLNQEANVTLLDASALTLRLVKIEIEPASINLGVNESQKMQLNGLYSDGTKKQLDIGKAKWTVKDFYVADMEDGTFYGRSTGSTTLTAHYGDLEASIPVAVANKPTGLKASFINESVKVQWLGVEHTDLLKGYYVYRRATDGQYSSTPLTDFPLQTTEFTDSNVDVTKEYYYICKAVYKEGLESQASNEVLATAKAKQIVMQLDNPLMTVNGVEKEIDEGNGTTPLLYNGRTILPIRALIEELGGTLEWQNQEQKITIHLNSSTVILWVDKPTALVNGVEQTLDVAPIILNGRTMIPLRFVGESLGLHLDWDGAEQKITLTVQEPAAKG